MTKEIILSRGFVALVDDDDYERASPYNWFATGTKPRPVRRWREGLIVKSQLLHRFILEPPAGLQVDHINGDVFDNRKANLRVCTAQQNSWNRKKPPGNAPYKGVRTRARCFTAELKTNGICIRLGAFSTAEEAARAYDAAAMHHYGDFARLNFPRDREAA